MKKLIFAFLAFLPLALLSQTTYYPKTDIGSTATTNSRLHYLNLQVLGTWGNLTNGSGTAPTSFAAGNTLSVSNQVNADFYTFVGTWRVASDFLLTIYPIILDDTLIHTGSVTIQDPRGYFKTGCEIPRLYTTTNCKGIGTLGIPIDPVATGTFHVGYSKYNPVSIKNNNAATDTFFVRVSDSTKRYGIHFDDNLLNRMWTISKKGADNTGGVDISFHWNKTDEIIGAVNTPAVFVFENNRWKKLATTILSDTAVAISDYKGELKSTQFIIADDTNGPSLKVNFITPFNGQSVPSTTNEIVIEFNKEVSASNLSEHIKVVGTYSGLITGTYTGGGTSTITFKPSRSFIQGEPITVNVLKSIGTTRIFSSQFSLSSNKFVKYSYGKTEFTNTYTGKVFPADLDADGDLDIVSGSNGKYGWFENDGSGNFTFKEISGATTDFIAAADLDMDGDLDLISSTLNSVRFWEKTNAGYNASVNLYTSLSASLGSNPLKFGDVDGDGDLDILCNFDTKLVLLKNPGTFPFTASDIKTMGSNQYVNLMDINADGYVDLVTSSSPNYNKINWFLNDGTGQFIENLYSIGENDLTSVVLLHANDDQLPDLAFDKYINRDIGGVSINHHQGVDKKPMYNQASTKIIQESGFKNSLLLPSDMNGDGNTDLVVNQSILTNRYVSIYQQNDTGFVSNSSLVGSVSVNSILFAADFNGDGFTDILTGGGSSSKKTVLFVNTAVAPNIVSSTLASDNSYIDLTFSTGVYGTLGGSQSLPGKGPITASSLKVLFEQSGGTATNVTVLSVNKPDSTDYDVAGKLVGGETVVRVFLDITGYPDGKETVEIVPAINSALYSIDGTSITSKQTSGVKTLNPYVTVHPTSISIDKQTVNLFVGGDSDSLTAIVLPKKTTDKSVTWSTSNAQVATVDANGNVTPVSLGTADIIATTVDGGLTASSAITVHPLTDRVFNQDGFSSSGFILKNPLTDDYELRGLTNYNGTFPISWGSANSIVYDKKQTIWLIPASITPGAAFVRINTTTKEVEKTLAKADFSMSVSAAVMVGDDIWFVPNSSDFVIKWNTKTFVSTKYNSWPSGVTFQNNSDKFRTGFYDGQKIWICGGNDNKVISIDAQTGDMKTYTWPTVRTYNGSGYTNALTANSFRGAVFDGRNIWFIPNLADRVVKLDTKTELMTGYDTWPNGYSQNDPKAVATGQSFNGGIFDGKNVWMIPNQAGSFIKIDTATGAMESYGNWPTGIKDTWSDQSYQGGVFDGKYIWSAPFFTTVGKSKAVIRFNTENGDMAKYENYPTAIPFRDNSIYFTGGVFDGKQVWFTGTGNNLQAFPLVYMGLPDVSVTSVALNKDTIIMRLGVATQALTATVSPTNASDKRVTWLSRNSSIASVNTSGVVSAVATGTTRVLVTTTDGSFKDSAVVIVLDRDTDGDGVDDTRETADGTDKNDAKKFKDSDGDGVPDAIETEQGTSPTDAKSFKDTDGGGTPDYVETVLIPNYGNTATDPNAAGDDAKDTDGDGVPDYNEILDGTDPTDNNSYKDSDKDLIPDLIELADGTDSTDAKKFKDSDGDGVPDYIEESQNTDPNDKTDFLDTDGGGMPDYVETVLLPNYGIKGNDKNTASDDTADSDKDGVSDFQELMDGTDPNDPGKYKDSDGDAVPDVVEINENTNPNDKNDFKDSDAGGIPDYVETILLPNYSLPATDPNNSSDDNKTSDYDKDGVPDSEEFKDGTDPKDSTEYKDFDGDLVPDYVESNLVDNTDGSNKTNYKDSDGDRVPDYIEKIDGTDPNDTTDFKDTDGDGVPDYIEEVFENTDPEDAKVYKDSDGDLVPDHIESTVVENTDGSNKTNYRDSDGDRVPDYIEKIEGTDPHDKTDFKDSDGDGVPDYIENIFDNSDPADAKNYKDTDGDLVPDYIESDVVEKTYPDDKTNYRDSDGDRVPDYIEKIEGTDPHDKTDFKDSDGDGVPDYIENVFDNSDPADAKDYKDTDGDLVPDYIESNVVENTYPDDKTNYRDSDGDRVPDYIEKIDGTDPNDTTDFKDSDGDGVPDYIENVFDNSDPADSKDYKDTDGDLVPDYIESDVVENTDEKNKSNYRDSDGDGVPDYIENFDGTDPNDTTDFKDTDGDGVPDYIEEVFENTDPSDAKDYKDTDGDLVPDYIENEVENSDSNNKLSYKDTDGDGVPDYVEDLNGTDPSDPKDFKDSDGDFVPDYIENNQGTDPADKSDFIDSDNSGVPDYVEDKLLPNMGLPGTDPNNPSDDASDTDGDGKSDYDELLDGTNPNDGPASISYDPSSVTATRGTEIDPIVPTFTVGKPREYSVSPDLPAGLSINELTGIISGTPTVAQPIEKLYVITGKNTGGTATTTFSLVIKDIPPADLSYTPATQRATKNVAISSMSPSSNGGDVEQYEIEPALPGGLLFNTTNGVISGTLTETLSGSVEYTITAINSGGSTTTMVTIVYNTPPSDLSISKANIFDSNAIGDLIGTFSSTDVDENETHSYSLVSGQGSTNNSAFTISGNRLLANRVYNYDVQRSYSIRVRTTDRGGLYHEEVINVTISKKPKLEGSSSPLYYGLINNQPVISLGTQSQLQISSSEIDSVSWSPATGLSATNILNPIATPSVTTTYSVYIRNIYGSVITLNITVEVKNDYSVQVSNIVTPNNDGINDFFIIDNIQNYPDNEVTIFDRNGKLLYKTANYNNRWDAKVNGKPLATGTYYYIVRFRNNPKALHKGYITIVNE